jgi:hypothetical protein
MIARRRSVVATVPVLEKASRGPWQGRVTDIAPVAGERRCETRSAYSIARVGGSLVCHRTGFFLVWETEGCWTQTIGHC